MTADTQVLTDEQILAIVSAAPAGPTAESEWLYVCRAIEAAVLSASAGEKRSMDRLEKFLDAAGGIGFVLAGIDAGDLYAELFPEQYASKSNQQDAQEKGKE